MAAPLVPDPRALRFVVGRFLREIPVSGEALQRALPELDEDERALVRTCVSLCAYEMTLVREVERGLEAQERGLAAFAAALQVAEARPSGAQPSPPSAGEPPRAA